MSISLQAISQSGKWQFKETGINTNIVKREQVRMKKSSSWLEKAHSKQKGAFK